jgi:hypothetical protein
VTALRRALWVAGAVLSSAPSCVANQHDEVAQPPANAAIETQKGELNESFFDHSFEVICSGPPEELAILGGVCGAKTRGLPAWETDAPYGAGAWIGTRSGPLFMVFAELPEGAGGEGDLRYAAFVVRRGAAENTAETLEQWKQGEPIVSGSVTTYEIRFDEACSDSWYAEGSFLWRSTMISFAWVAGMGC